MIKNEQVIELLTIIEDMENPPTLIYKGENLTFEWEDGLDCKTEEGQKIKKWLLSISKNEPLGDSEELEIEE